MQKPKAFIAFSACIGVFSLACEINNRKVDFSDLPVLQDSIRNKGPIAAFYEYDALSVFLKNGDSLPIISHYTFRKCCPVFTDILQQNNAGDFYSPRFDHHYKVSDSTVTLVYFEKMVHPCYNWQGQAPVLKKQEIIFRRIEIKQP